MNNNRGISLSSGGIRKKMLVWLLGISAIMLFIIAFVAIQSTRSQGRTAREISGQALQTQAEKYMQQLTVSSAAENDLILETLRVNAQQLASYAGDIYSNQELYTNHDNWKVEEHMNIGSNGQFMNSESDTTSIFVPNFQNINVNVIHDIEIGVFLDNMIVSIYKSSPDITAVYFATPNEVTRYYPNINLGAVLPADFLVTQRPWYVGSNLGSDPDRKAWWSPVYVDATGRGLVTTAAAPGYNQFQELVGVVGLDVTLNEMKTNVEATRILESGYSFLVDQTGQSIALPEQGYQDILNRTPEAGETSTDLTKAIAPFDKVIVAMMTGNTGFEKVTTHNELLYVAYAPLKNTGWSLGTVGRANEVLGAVADLQTQLDRSNRSLVYFRILPVTAALFLIIVLMGGILIGRLIDPIQKLAIASQKIAAGQWDVEIPRVGGDEIGLLAKSFESMTLQLHSIVSDLEIHVNERTKELSHRTAQLEAASQVAREASAIRNVDILLNRVTNLISEKFGFYHAGIFLLDDYNEYAILRATNSIGGKQMLLRGHHIKVGGTSIVGFVAGMGRARIAFDVGEDAIYLKNPDLPDTRSELAVPLKVHEHIIGVLDVQSIEPSAFSEDDVQIIQVLADQIALAVDNARLFDDGQNAMKALKQIQGEQTIEAWDHLLGNRQVVYTYDRSGLIVDTHNMSENKIIREPVIDTNGKYHQLVVPIIIRDQTIGKLTLRRDLIDEPWTIEELTLVEKTISQIVPALENARLLEEAQMRAEQEKTLNLITGQVRGSASLDTILQNTVHALGKALGVSRTFIHFGMLEQTSQETDSGENKELIGK